MKHTNANSTANRGGIYKFQGMSINLKTDEEIHKMRMAGRLAAQVLKYAGQMVQPGVTTLEINDRVEKYTRERGAVSAPLNYRGFPKSICTSVDHVVCHGIPDKQPLLAGQIINIDITVILDGFHGDTSATFMVGDVSANLKKLMFVARSAMQRGIDLVRPGTTLGDIGYSIQTYVERNGYSVVRDFIGHGIGRSFHEDPPVAHVGKRGKGVPLVPGMTFTIEPMVNMGAYHVEVLKDKWTVVTKDRQPSAQYEHTVLVTPTGVEILTPWDEDMLP